MSVTVDTTHVTVEDSQGRQLHLDGVQGDVVVVSGRASATLDDLEILMQALSSFYNSGLFIGGE